MNFEFRLVLAIIAISLNLVVADQVSLGGTALQPAKTYESKDPVPGKLDYLLSLPTGYAQSTNSWPLVLFLHGSGESGHDLNRVKVHGPPKLVEKNGPFPFILISPQSPGRGWNPEMLNGLIDSVIEVYRVDRDRVYVTGLSMGGFGTWALAAAHPEKLAAIAPICGGGKPADARKLAKLAIWVFHGAKDPTVPLRRSEEMVEALKTVGGNPKFTVYPEAKHDSWTVTYDNPEFYHWLLAQRRSKQ